MQKEKTVSACNNCGMQISSNWLEVETGLDHDIHRCRDVLAQQRRILITSLRFLDTEEAKVMLRVLHGLEEG